MREVTKSEAGVERIRYLLGEIEDYDTLGTEQPE